MRELSKYSFANAKIRAMLSCLLSQEQVSRLIEAKDIQALVELLKNTSYKTVIDKAPQRVQDLQAAEKELLRADLQIYKKVYKMLAKGAEKDCVGLLIQRYEIDELKTALRLWHKRYTASLNDYILQKKIVFDIDFEKLMTCRSLEEIIAILEDTPYAPQLLRAKDKFKEHDSTFYLETALDIDYYERLTEAVRKLGFYDRKVASKIIGVEIDIENINSLLKLRKYYSVGVADMMELVISGGAWVDKETIRRVYVTNGLTKIVEGVSLGPYAKIKDLVEENIYFIENFLYEILLREVHRVLSGFPFTIGTILGYLILKRRETKNIISLLYAKTLGLKKEETSNLLGK